MASLSDSGAGGKCVLLTGARGFTGAYVRAELEAAGYCVVGTVIGDADAQELVLDLTSLDACRAVVQRVQPDFIVHLAAVSFVQHANPDEFYRVNVVGTTNLLQAASEPGLTPQRILIASSANIYGNAGGVLTESQTPRPVNHYAASKLAMEYMIATWTDRLPIVVTRPFNYTGVGQEARFLVPKIVSHFARRAEQIELGNLDVERDFSDVRDVARAYRLLMECDAASDSVVNICSGRVVALRDVIEMMQQIAQYQIEVKVNQAYVRMSEVKTLIGAPGRLQELTGDAGDVMAIPFRETLEWMYGAACSSEGT